MNEAGRRLTLTLDWKQYWDNVLEHGIKIVLLNPHKMIRIDNQLQYAITAEIILFLDKKPQLFSLDDLTRNPISCRKETEVLDPEKEAVTRVSCAVDLKYEEDRPSSSSSSSSSFEKILPKRKYSAYEEGNMRALSNHLYELCRDYVKGKMNEELMHLLQAQDPFLRENEKQKKKAVIDVCQKYFVHLPDTEQMERKIDRMVKETLKVSSSFEVNRIKLMNVEGNRIQSMNSEEERDVFGSGFGYGSMTGIQTSFESSIITTEEEV